MDCGLDQAIRELNFSEFTRLGLLIKRIMNLERASAQAKHTEGDLTEDAVAGKGFGENADHETEHGHTTVQQFSACHALTFDLCGSSVLEPGVFVR